MRKLLVITSIIIIISVGGYLGWQVWNSRSANTNQEPNNVIPIQSIFKKESESKLISYTILSSGEILGVTLNGSIVSINNGAETEIFSQDLKGIVSATFSPTKNYVLFETVVNGLISLSIFDIKNQTWNPIANAASSGVWDPERDRIAYIRNATAPMLSLFDIATKKNTDIIPFSMRDAVLSWRNPQNVFITGRPASSVIQSAWHVHVTNKTITAVIPETLGLDAILNENGSSALFSRYNGRIYETFIANLGQGTAVDNFANTIPSKCLLKNEMVVCAIPKNIPAGTLLPDDYESKQFYTEDELYAWNTTTNELYRIDANDILSIDAHRITELDGKIFFLNRYDQLLYSLPSNNN